MICMFLPRPPEVESIYRIILHVCTTTNTAAHATRYTILHAYAWLCRARNIGLAWP